MATFKNRIYKKKTRKAGAKTFEPVSDEAVSAVREPDAEVKEKLSPDDLYKIKLLQEDPTYEINVTSEEELWDNRTFLLHYDRAAQIDQIERIKLKTPELIAKYEEERMYKLHVSTHQEQIRSSIVLNTEKMLYEINNLIEQEINVIDLTMQYLIQTKSIHAPEIAEPKVGGHVNPFLNEQLVKALEYGKYDTAHDFKPSKRNGLFPNGKTDVNVDNGKAFLDSLKTYIEDKSAMDGELDDICYKYPLRFEDPIKTNFFLGTLTGNLEDVLYHFSKKQAKGDDYVGKNWEKPKAQWFAANDDKVGNLESLFTTVNANDIEYWIYDACVSSSGVLSKLSKPELITLSKLWDPSNNKPIKMNDLGEKILELKTDARLTEEEEYLGHKIYDWKKDGRSLYDAIYDPLLNHDPLSIVQKFNIKLRIAVDSTQVCKLCIIITYEEDTLKLIINRGFSVKELSMGLHYIESGDPADYKDVSLKPDLKSIIDFLEEHYEPSAAKVNYAHKSQAYKLLFRFKASGDHGQSKMVKLINEELKINTVFISGDNLAYTNSTADGINTIGCYFKASSGTDDDSDDEEEKQDEKPGEPQYIFSFFQKSDGPEKFKVKFEYLYSNLLNMYSLYEIKPKENLTELTEADIDTITSQFDSIITTNLKTIEDLKKIKIHYGDEGKNAEEIYRLTHTTVEKILNDINIGDILAISKTFSWLNKEEPPETTLFGKPPPIKPDVKDENYDRISKEYYDKVKLFIEKILTFINTTYFIQNYVYIVNYTRHYVLDTISKLNEFGRFELPSILNNTFLTAGKLSTRFFTFITKEDDESRILTRYAEHPITNTETLSIKIEKKAKELIESRRRMTSTIIQGLQLDKKAYDAVTDHIDEIKIIYIYRILQHMRSAHGGESYANYFQNFFLTPSMSKEKMEQLGSEDQFDLLHILNEKRRREAEALTKMNEKKKCSKARLDEIHLTNQYFTTVELITEKLDRARTAYSALLLRSDPANKKHKQAIENKEAMIAETKEKYDETIAEYEELKKIYDKSLTELEEARENYEQYNSRIIKRITVEQELEEFLTKLHKSPQEGDEPFARTVQEEVTSSSTGMESALVLDALLKGMPILLFGPELSSHPSFTTESTSSPSPKDGETDGSLPPTIVGETDGSEPPTIVGETDGSEPLFSVPVIPPSPATEESPGSESPPSTDGTELPSPDTEELPGSESPPSTDGRELPSPDTEESPGSESPPSTDGTELPSPDTEESLSSSTTESTLSTVGDSPDDLLPPIKRSERLAKAAEDRIKEAKMTSLPVIPKKSEKAATAAEGKIKEAKRAMSEKSERAAKAAETRRRNKEEEDREAAKRIMSSRLRSKGGTRRKKITKRKGINQKRKTIRKRNRY